MAKHLTGIAVAHLLCCLVFLEQSLGINECLKQYSTSHKRKSTQTPGQNQQHYLADYAVDGRDETCQKTIVTSQKVRPWWQVNLDKKVNVSFIRVTNSKRHPSSFGVYVRYDINSEGMACGRFHVLGANETRIIRCPTTFGRSVRIVGTKTNDFLSLCEVQVFNDTVKITEGVLYDVWFNETNPSFYFINNREAHSSGILSSFQTPRDISDHYGARMITYFNAPENGTYMFNISGDNKCKLYIRNVKVRKAIDIARIPRNNDVDRPWTRYDSWNQAYVKPVTLIKGNVYELTALMIEIDKKDHLRVGVTFPNGTFVGPLQSRIFTSEEAARSLTRNSCSSKDVVVPPSSKPTEPSIEDEIYNAAFAFLKAEQNSKSKFEKLAELEKRGFEMAEKLSLGKKFFASYAFQKENLVFAAVAMNLSKSRSFHFPGDLQNFSSFADQGSIIVPKRAFPVGTGRASAVFMLFKTFKKMSQQTGATASHLTNFVVSASMKAEILNDLEKPFTLRFKNSKVSITDQRHCVYWIEDEHCEKDGKFGSWSDHGCRLIDKNETHTTCQCDHLTKFAVLFPVKEGSAEDEMKLELITYVGLSLSSVGCFITFAVYLLLRITKTLKVVVHLNLVLALGLADLIFLLGNLVENYKEMCFVSTVLSFYFYLAVFTWMLNEGIHLYFLVIRVFGRDDHRRKQYYYMFGWGAPAIVVLVTAGILQYDLMDQSHCWLSSKSASIWVFIGPVLFVVLVNSLILAAVLRTTMTLLRNDPGHRKEKSAMRTLAMLVPLLGTTWIFGVIAFAHDSIIFQYIFAICNAFQGFFIFILYCLFNTEVRHEYQRRRKAWKTERELDSKRSPQNNSSDV